MRNLVPLTHSEQTDYENISSTRRVVATRDLLLAAKSEVFRAYGRYVTDFSSDAGHALMPVANTPARAAAMSGNFDALNKRARAEHLRDSLLKTVAPDRNLCPYCLVNYVARALDHVLPKMKYPEFSIMHRNLVPICDDCNRRKGELCPLTGHSFLNAYLSILPPGATYLQVQIDGNPDGYGFDYQLRRGSGLTLSQEASLQDHLDILELSRRWGDAAALLASETAHLIDEYAVPVGAGVTRFLSACARAAVRELGNNYWKSVAYVGLSGSADYCNGGYKKLLKG